MTSSRISKTNPLNADIVFMPIKNRLSLFSLLLLIPFLLSSSAGAAVLSSDTEDQILVEQNMKNEDFTKNAANLAKIIDVAGDVRILKNNSEDWAAASKGDFVETGDQIITGKLSSVDIALDAYLLNIAHIKENTKAEFRSLKPADIYLEDGTIYSVLDGLASDDGYQIATPTAVAAVRGTHFEVGYDGSNKKFSATAVPTDDPEHTSRVFIHSSDQSSSEGVEITDGKELALQMGQRPEQKFVRAADPSKLQEARSFLPRIEGRVKDFQAMRQEGKVHFQERQQQLKRQMPQPGQGTRFNPGQKNPNGQNFPINQKPESMQPRREQGSVFEGNSGVFPGPNEKSKNFPEFRPKEPKQDQGNQPQGLSRPMQGNRFENKNLNMPQNERRARQMNPQQNGFRPPINNGPQQSGGPKNEGRPAGSPPAQKKQ